MKGLEKEVEELKMKEVWEAEMEWGSESKRDAVTRGDGVFILVCQRPVDLGRGCKGDGISIRSHDRMICMIKRSWTRLKVGKGANQHGQMTHLGCHSW